MRRDRAARARHHAHVATSLIIRRCGSGSATSSWSGSDGWPGIRVTIGCPNRMCAVCRMILPIEGCNPDRCRPHRSVFHGCGDRPLRSDDARWTICKFFPVYDAIMVCRDDVPDGDSTIVESSRRPDRRNDHDEDECARRLWIASPRRRSRRAFLRDQLHVTAEAKVQSRFCAHLAADAGAPGDGRHLARAWRCWLRCRWVSLRSIVGASGEWCLRSPIFCKHCRRWRCWCS